MAISCTPASLAAAAKCFQCLPSEQKQWIDTYLLAVIAGGSTDPNTLALAAKCFQCIPPGMLRRIQAYLLCQVASGGSGDCPQDMQVAWTPTNLKLGEMLGFFTYGNIGAITSITFDQATSIPGFDIESTSTVTSITFPNLVSVDLGNTQGGYLNLEGNSALATFTAPLLASVAGFLSVRNSGAGLTVVNLPSLVSTGGIQISSNSGLVTVTVPVLVPDNGITLNFGGNALSAASVNAILARAIANAAYVSGNIILSGGTNAAPSGQGIADKAALILRGATVTTN